MNVQVITGVSGKIKDAVEAYKAGKYQTAQQANVGDHFGSPQGGGGQAMNQQMFGGGQMGGGRGMGRGGGRGMGRGMGGGGGRGMGRGF